MKIIKFLFKATVLVFLVVLFYIYAMLPEQVVLYNDVSLSQNTFFYTFFILFLLLNGVVYVGASIFSKYANNNNGNNSILWNKIALWLQSFGLVINTLLIVTILFWGGYNNSGFVSFKNISFLPYVGLSILVLWVFSLFFLFRGVYLNKR